jgi:homoserine dehydrogenase
MSTITVLKFGSSVLPDERRFPGAVAEIQRNLQRGRRVVAVVSALGNTTDRLIAYAKRHARDPDPVALAALLATGEATATALLALALQSAGVQANVLDPGALGLSTTGPTLDASAQGLDCTRIGAVLAERPVLVVPGFIGRDDHGRATLLGRGGSDLTALFIAARLRQAGREAECRLLKDVDGLYDRDPASESATPARRFETVSYDDVLALDEGIVQHKAVRYARDHALSFTVGRLGVAHGTLVSAEPSRFAGAAGQDVNGSINEEAAV